MLKKGKDHAALFSSVSDHCAHRGVPWILGTRGGVGGNRQDFVRSVPDPVSGQPDIRTENSLNTTTKGVKHMNWDQIEGNWAQFKGKVREQWGRLTDDDIDIINGKREQLVGRVQEAYGCMREEAEKQVREFEKNADRLFDKTRSRQATATR
jgi:uncharacterized protein YjbJ (UPF0337 family)